MSSRAYLRALAIDLNLGDVEGSFGEEEFYGGYI
jgi:hypothetical protein